MGKKPTNKPVIVERVACDYLRVTTFSHDTWAEWHAIIGKMNLSNPTKEAFKQYSGVGWEEGVSVVEGIQKGEPHYMLDVSGAMAAQVMEYLREWQSLDRESLKCTRIDVQITLLPIVDRPHLIDLAIRTKEGEYGEWRGRGRPGIEAYFGETGDTLYIGSRLSEIFCRVYEKPVTRRGGITKTYERYEVEYKGSRANALFWRAMKAPQGKHDKPFLQALQAHINTLPVGLMTRLAARQLVEYGEAGLMPEMTPRGRGSKARWVESIENALAKAAALPGEDGRRVRMALINAFLYGVEGDNITGANQVAIVTNSGGVYNREGIEYNKTVGRGGVVISDIDHSTITIETVVGSDYNQGYKPGKRPTGQGEGSDGTS